MRKTILTAALLCAFLGTQAQEYYEKHVAFPAGATTEQKIDMASRLVPTPQQLAWQQMEFTCFLHFGINTFTGREWGDGKEDPAIFNPTELDCEQWVRALKEGGFKMAIITAKHHDGFCLWPTRTTKHSVASSPWKNGKGDVVQELRKACDKYGLKFGVYLSPWDRNAECYGQGEAYNKFFIEQLTELLTNYGEVHEVWFDGANGEGPNGKKQEFHKAFESLGTAFLRKNKDIGQYIYAMTKNTTFNFIKRKRVEQSYQEQLSQKYLIEDLLKSEDTLDPIYYKEALLIIRLILDRLPERRRKVFEMSRINNMSNMEIAQALNISVRTVEHQIYLTLLEIKKTIFIAFFLCFF